MKKLITICAVVTVLVCGGMVRADIDLSSPAWSVEHIINNSETVFGVDQGNFGMNGPRSNRSLALSPDGDFMYLGYGDPGWFVRKVEIGHAPGDNVTSVKAQLGLTDEGKSLNWAKSLATDDQGRVYITRNLEIQVYDADLTTRLLTVTGFSKAEGVHVARADTGKVYLYNTERDLTSGQLKRMVLTEATDFASGTMAWSGDASFGGGDGMADLGGENDARGIATDDNGNIWVAENDNSLFRVSNDGVTLIDSIGLSDAFDVAIDGNKVFVSQDDDKTVSIINATTMALLDTLSVPFAALQLDEGGQSGYGTLGGIDVVSNSALFVSNEYGQSLDPSAYSDYAGDDNEPVLKVTPEPATMSLLALGGLAVLRRRRLRS